MKKRIKDFIHSLENSGIPLFYYIATLAAVIAMENFLEIFSDTPLVSFALFPFSHPLSLPASVSIAISFGHTTLWWIAFFLFLPAVLSIACRQDMGKTMRAVFSFSWVALLIPITDLIVSGGKGIDIRYVYPKGITDLLRLPIYLTPGENLAFAIILAFSFIYCYLKKAGLGRTIGGLTALVSFLLFLALMPFLLKKVFHLAGLHLEFFSPILLIRLLIWLVSMELAVILYVRNKGAFLSLFTGIDLKKFLSFILLFLLGILLARSHILRYILENTGSFILSITAIFLLYCLSILAQRMEPQGVPLPEARNIATTLALSAIGCALAVNFTTCYFALAAAAILYMYYFYPLQLKRFLFLSKAALSSVLLLIVMLGWLFAGGEIWEFPQIFSLYFLVFFSLSLNYFDLKENPDTDTLPAFSGLKEAKIIVGLSCLVSYLLIPWLFLEKNLIFPSAALGLLQFYIVVRRQYQERLFLWVYLLSLALALFWLNSFRSF